VLGNTQAAEQQQQQQQQQQQTRTTTTTTTRTTIPLLLCIGSDIGKASVINELHSLIAR
jgi:hypothetical protein